MVSPEGLAERVSLLGPALRRRWGRPVRKLPLDAGATCPVRDGSKGRGGCSFCPPSGSGNGAGAVPLAEQVEAGLARLRASAGRRGRKMPAVLAYYQAFSTTHCAAGELAARLEPALRHPAVDGVIVATRPDCLDGPRWEVLAAAAARKPLWLELGLQSSSDATLAAVGRGHDVACFDRAVARARERGLEVVAHVILGLPGEDEAACLATAEHLAGLGVEGVKLHNCMVLEGTRLAGDWRAGRYRPWEREAWARCAARFLARLPAGMLVHRLAADPGRDRLLAPEWAADKAGALAALAAAMEELGLEQASHA